MGQSPVQGVLPNCKKGSYFQKFILNRKRPEGLHHELYNNLYFQIEAYGAEEYNSIILVFHQQVTLYHQF